jgi:hypothetical protein
MNRLIHVLDKPYPFLLLHAKTKIFCLLLCVYGWWMKTKKQAILLPVKGEINQNLSLTFQFFEI